MVSCGTCGKWQHIACHDVADYKAGYPKRNWDTQPFICQRCRSARVARPNNGHDRNTLLDQYTWSQPRPKSPVQPTQSVQYLQPTSEERYSQQPSFDCRVVHSQQAQQYPRSAVPYSRPQEISFSHYQPEQHGFSQSMDAARWRGNYPGTEYANGRPQGTYQTNHLNEQMSYSHRITPYQVRVMSVFWYSTQQHTSQGPSSSSSQSNP